MATRAVFAISRLTGRRLRERGRAKDWSKQGSTGEHGILILYRAPDRSACCQRGERTSPGFVPSWPDMDTPAQLPRRLGLFDAAAIVVGTTIGAGIFLVPNLV